MPVRIGKAVWEGSIKDGKGILELGEGKVKANYSFASRFESGKGTNPEELIGAAHAGCFSMAFSMMLGNAGFIPKKITTTASVAIESSGQGFAITSIKLNTEGHVPNISPEEFKKIAEQAKKDCPVSKALSAVPKIDIEAKLLQ